MAEQTFVRTRDPEPVQLPELAAGYRNRNAFIERQFKGRILIKGKEIKENTSRQGRTRFYISPNYYDDTVLQDWYLFTNNIVVHSGKHIHQGGICLYVLQGSGYTVVDGERYDWTAGDLVLLPVKPGGCEHQHFNREEGKGAMWMAFIYLPYHDLVASGLKQVELSADFKNVPGANTPDENAAYQPNRDFSGWPDDSFGAIPPANGFNGYFDLIRRRQESREWLAQAEAIIRGAELPWETNPQGITQWYMHPGLYAPAVRTYLFYRQDIPGGSRSGRQRHQGDQIIYFLEGEGYTLMDGVRYDWEAGDALQIPLRPDGTIFQHFNGSSSSAARFVACEPNTVDALGVDRGSGFVQLENCPEFLRS